MAQSGRTKQGDEAPPQRRNWAGAVTGDASAAAATAFQRKGFRDPTLILRWDEIVGAEVARIARPLKMSEGAQGGILTLKSEPAASLFLQHESRVICERINAYLGRPAVARLRFVQGPLATRSVPGRLKPVGKSAPADDPARRYHGAEGLKAALLALAAARRTP